MPNLTDFALVAVGGAAGSVLRVVVADGVTRAVGASFPNIGAFPFGTLAVNVTGAMLLGFLAALIARDVPDGIAGLAPLFVAGAIGSYTTVSTFSLQTILLMRDGLPGRACANVVGSVAACLAAAACGLGLGEAILGAA